MKKLIRYTASFSLILLMLCSCCFASLALEIKDTGLELDAKSVVLIDANTGTLLYAHNKDEALPPASVTKIMTLLLVMEAVDTGKFSLEDAVPVSEYAASMGGSQIFLEVGETMTVRDMIKSVVIASANDAAVALAELVAGSEAAFVSQMNKRAVELGMLNTFFENVTGLDDDTVNHLTSAYDIALMSRELLKHKTILEYTSIWMDTVRNGAFGLTNTNRLIRFYNGATGLKTGSTAKAKFCMSATAEREGLHLIAVVMGASSRDARNLSAQRLLDFGFANYAIYRDEEESMQIPILGANVRTFSATFTAYDILINKEDSNKIERSVEIKENISAPIEEGECVGSIIYTCNGTEIGRSDILSEETVKKIGFFELYLRVLKKSILT